MSDTANSPASMRGWAIWAWALWRRVRSDYRQMAQTYRQTRFVGSWTKRHRYAVPELDRTSGFRR